MAQPRQRLGMSTAATDKLRVTPVQSGRLGDSAQLSGADEAGEIALAHLARWGREWKLARWSRASFP